MYPKNKLIILDRDGVINEDSKNYIKSSDEWIPIPGSIEAIAHLSQKGFQVAIATNQSGIARGYFSHNILAQMHAKMQTLVQQAHGHIDWIEYCPHINEDHCSCRKPKAGMLQNIQKHFEFSNDDMHSVYVVGDSLRDLQAAHTIGAKPVLVLTGKGAHTKHYLSLEMKKRLDIFGIYDNLAQFVTILIGEH